MCVGLAARGDHVDLAAVGKLQRGGAELFVHDHHRAQYPPHRAGEGDGVTLHHEVDVGAGRAIQEGIADKTTDRAHRDIEVRESRRQGMGRGDTARDEAKIGGVTHDSLSEKLAQQAPIALPRLTAVIEQYETLSLAELTRRRSECEEGFRAWARDPGNAGTPISEAPDYLDRIALDSLLERRMFAE
jgi:hypothetical protein